MKLLSSFPLVEARHGLKVVSREQSAEALRKYGVDVGEPLSALPQQIQERLRAGQFVDARATSPLSLPDTGS